MSAAAWSTAATVASTAMSLYNGMKQGESAQGMANYNAAVSRNNAQAAEWQAQDATKRGQEQAEANSRKVAMLKGSQTASMAAHGLDISEGTPVNILTDTDLLGEIDTNTIQQNASKEAWGHRAKAANASTQAGMYDMQANNSSGLMSGAGSLISGAASLADRWYRSKNNLAAG
jgi:hypothetical protein